MKHFDIRVRCFFQRIRYWMIGRLLKSREVEDICIALEKGFKTLYYESLNEKDIERAKQLKEDAYTLDSTITWINKDFYNSKFKDVW